MRDDMGKYRTFILFFMATGVGLVLGDYSGVHFNTVVAVSIVPSTDG